MVDYITLPSPESVHAVAVEKGWYEERNAENQSITMTPENMSKYFVPSVIALIHSEASEALEVYRKEGITNGKEQLAEELADIVLRVLDVSGFLGVDIEKAIHEKHLHNKERPQRHGDKLV